MRYSRIASVLQEIALAPRSSKADIAADFLADILDEPGMLCPAVRLLIGELWPPWENRVMGVGPETLAAALAEVSDFDVTAQRKEGSEMGLLAEMALQQKGQHPLVREPLEALSTYDGLRRISALKGRESEQRKIGILRGLFLVATPLEGKFIARTALRGNQVGMGARTMIAALSVALQRDPEAIRRAYGLMPDLGGISERALKGDLNGVSIRPSVPARPMLFFPGEPPLPGAYLPRYPGLRVQVHKTGNAVLIFSSQLRDVTPALNGLSRQIGEQDADFVVDADLIGFYNTGRDERGSSAARICSQAEMLRYINRRRLSRKSSIRPALLAYDLLAIGDKDICSMPYQDRRVRLLSILGQPQALPFSGISAASETVLNEKSSVEDFLGQAVKSGARSILGRDLQGAYCPGEAAHRDVIIRSEHHLSTILVRVQWGRGKREGLPERYQVALRNGEQLVPVGWIRRGLSRKDQLALSSVLLPLMKGEDKEAVVLAAQIRLMLRIRGAHKRGDEFVLLEPMIEGYRLHSSVEDADDLSLLESICIQ